MIQLLSLDPSSSVIGYARAVQDRTRQIGWRFSEAGLLKPARARDKPLERIAYMVDQLEEVIIKRSRRGPVLVIIETTSGKVNRNRHGGGGAGLGVYGMAVGAAWQAVRKNANVSNVLPYTENQWTGGHGKRKHRAVARKYWPDYAALEGSDKGSDVADAISLAVWYLTTQRTKP